MHLMKKIRFPLFGLLLGLSTLTTADDVVPVVSPDNPVDSLGKYELVNIFLGKNLRFPDGSPAAPVDQVESSRVRDRFYSEFTGKSAAQIKAYWSKMIFTGRGQPPKTLDDGNAVKQWVSDNPSAIGYIERSMADETVKILSVE